MRNNFLTRPFSRRALTAALAAFFGCVSLFGQALHCLVGHAYHGGPSAVACAHHGLPGHAAHAHEAHAHDAAGNAAEHACHDAHAGADHDHEACSELSLAARQRAHEDGGEAKLIARPAHDEHTCPICDFFGQAQRIAEARAADLEVVFSPLAPLAEPSRATVFGGVYQSRAPPFGGAIL